MRFPRRTLSIPRTISTHLHWATATAVAVISVVFMIFYAIESQRIETALAERIRTATDVAASIVSAYEREERGGQMTRAQAQTAAVAEIEVMRFGMGGHVLIADQSPKMVMHPLEPALKGTDLTTVMGADGTPLYAAFIEMARSGRTGAAALPWPRASTASQAAPATLSYVERFAPWGWVLCGTAETGELAGARWRVALGLIAFAILCGLAVGVAISRLSLDLAVSVRELSATTEMLSQGDLSVVVPGTGRRDELGALAYALEALKRGAIERHRIVRLGLEERTAKERRQAAMDRLTRDFSATVAGVLTRLTVEARLVSGTARNIGEGSVRTQDYVTRTAEAATLAARELAAMATAADGLSAKAGEPARASELFSGGMASRPKRAARGIAKNAPKTMVKSEPGDPLGQEPEAAAEVDRRTVAARRIIVGIQMIAQTSATTAAAMTEVATIAGETGVMSEIVATSSEALGQAATTLRDEVDQFVRTLSHGDALRRRYERVPADGVPASMFVPNGPRIHAEIKDISRGGAALNSSYRGDVGDEVLVLLPGSTEPVAARIVRHADGIVAVAFRQDERTMREVDALIDALTLGTPALWAA